MSRQLSPSVWRGGEVTNFVERYPVLDVSRIRRSRFFTKMRAVKLTRQCCCRSAGLWRALVADVQHDGRFASRAFRCLRSISPQAAIVRCEVLSRYLHSFRMLIFFARPWGVNHSRLWVGWANRQYLHSTCMCSACGVASDGRASGITVRNVDSEPCAFP